MTQEQITAEQARAALEEAGAGRRRIVAEGEALPLRLIAYVSPYVGWWGIQAGVPEGWLKNAVHIGVVVLMCTGVAHSARLGRIKLRTGAAGPVGYLLPPTAVLLTFGAYLAAFFAFRELGVSPRVPATAVLLTTLLLATVGVNRLFRILALRRSA